MNFWQCCSKESNLAWPTAIIILINQFCRLGNGDYLTYLGIAAFTVTVTFAILGYIRYIRQD